MIRTGYPNKGVHMSQSRVIRNFIGERFKPLDDEQNHWCGESGTCGPTCRTIGSWAPIVLHTVNFNDLKSGDPHQQMLLNYSDGEEYDPVGRKSLVCLRQEAGRHPGAHPYVLVEIVYEGLRKQLNGVSGRMFDRCRFRIEKLVEPLPASFIDVPRNLGLPSAVLADFIRRHADPDVAEPLIVAP